MELTLEEIKLNSLTFQKGMLHPNRQDQFDTQIGHTVINLTDQSFSKDELELLNKGLSFSPSPHKHSIPDLWLDFKHFERTLSLKHFFHNQPKKPTDPLIKFKDKSKWKPPMLPLEIQQFTRLLKNSW